jgi:hypothetical protein
VSLTTSGAALRPGCCSFLIERPTGVMSWRRLVERTTGWTPELYAPLRVVLSPDEAHKWAAFLPQVAAGEGRAPPSLVAGAVQRRHLEVCGWQSWREWCSC